MNRARLLIVAAIAMLAGCTVAPMRNLYAETDSCLNAGQAWNYRTKRCEPAASGPVDRIVVEKSLHWMSVYRAGRLVREFRVSLGRGGPGPKQRQGDARVPEGLYRITAHNPNSAYHRSLRIGYPTVQQTRAALARGVDPGGDIMIHGLPNGDGDVGSRHVLIDWTDGCVAVTDREIEWLYRAVPNGTPIEIRG